jgi:hypothetical protein
MIAAATAITPATEPITPQANCSQRCCQAAACVPRAAPGGRELTEDTLARRRVLGDGHLDTMATPTSGQADQLRKQALLAAGHRPLTRCRRSRTMTRCSRLR